MAYRQRSNKKRLVSVKGLVFLYVSEIKKKGQLAVYLINIDVCICNNQQYKVKANVYHYLTPTNSLTMLEVCHI